MDSLADAIRRGPIVLDGGLATELEEQGHDLSSVLWSAQLLIDDPEAIVRAHRAYFAAGAQVATTASYQAPQGLLTDSVRLARRAQNETPNERGEPRWVVGSVGPYGASLADGSEYRGGYDLSVAQLRRWHRPRIAALVEAGVDVLALETLPCLSEVEALLAELDGIGVPAWVSLTIAGDRTRAGEPAVEAYAMAADVVEVIAVGVNCSSPMDATHAVPIAARTSGKSVVVYPNRGEVWDALGRRWEEARDSSEVFSSGAVRRWIDDGARLIGGCCQVGPAEITELAIKMHSA